MTSVGNIVRGPWVRTVDQFPMSTDSKLMSKQATVETNREFLLINRRTH